MAMSSRPLPCTLPAAAAGYAGSGMTATEIDARRRGRARRSRTACWARTGSRAACSCGPSVRPRPPCGCCRNEGSPSSSGRRTRPGVFEAVLPGKRSAARLPARGRLPATARRSPCATRTPSAHARRARPAPDRARAATSSSGTRSARIRATLDGARGTSFAVWAPAARAVGVVGDFNGWNERAHPMRSLGSRRRLGALRARGRGRAGYKFAIRGADGAVRLKADPGRAAHRAAAADGLDRLRDRATSGATQAWLERRREAQPHAAPISIYEVHLGSWRLNPLEGNRSLTYTELADELADYALEPRLHARRAAARHGAPVHRLVGLPGDGLLRPDLALRGARRVPRPSSTACTSAGSA